MSGGITTGLPNQFNQLGGFYGFGQPNQTFHGNSLNPANQFAAFGAAQGIAAAQRNPAPAHPIPREGIRAGEITAYRAWALTRGLNWLKSVSADRIWIPGETMEGDVSQHGIYCFKHPAYVEDAFGYGQYVVGSIEIWGEIIEHEKGYRAQYARIKSLDKIWGITEKTTGFWRKRKTEHGKEILALLRERYCTLDASYEIP